MCSPPSMNKESLFLKSILEVSFFLGRKLYYFHKDSELEIDFITRYKGKATIIEV